MARLRPPVAPSHPLASPTALASFATSQHAPEMLIRGGPYQRAVKVMASGADAMTASVVAAAQGKGHVAELAQSAHFTASSAALGGPHHARPNPLANDPRVDVEVRRGRARVSGSQVKVGSPQYVRRAVRAGKYENLIVNAESFEHVAHAPGVTDRLGHAGIAAPQLTADEVETTATDALHRMLTERDVATQLDALVRAGQAGLRDGVVSFGLGLVEQVADAVFRRLPLDVRAAVRAALSGAARSAARTGIEAWMLLRRFAEKAGAAFSSRLLHRIARSRLTASAVAEVVVETAIDLVAVLRRQMSFEQLLRRFGVHVTTAGGGALGAAAGLALTRGRPSWLRVLAVLLGGWVGSHGGRALGEGLFLPAPRRLAPAANGLACARCVSGLQ